MGYWSNTYPLKYIYFRILDILFNLSRNIDLRLLMKNEKDISLFFKGIYLLIKAFPGLNEEIINFLNLIKNRIDYLISDNTTNNNVKKMLDRMFYFIDIALIKSRYENKNTSFIIVSNN